MHTFATDPRHELAQERAGWAVDPLEWIEQSFSLDWPQSMPD